MAATAGQRRDESGGGTELRRSTLGRGPVAVTELSFGAAGIAGLYTPVTAEDAAAAVNAAWDAGIRSFDTAPHYGLGLSERRLGAALRDRPRDQYVLSTKVGRLLVPADGAGGAAVGRASADGAAVGTAEAGGAEAGGAAVGSPEARGAAVDGAEAGTDDLDLANGFAVPATHRRVWDFSADGVRRSLEASLERLGLDRVDIVYIHDPDDHAEQAFGEAYPALERLRAEGTVRAIGAGMNQAGMLHRFVRDTDVDVVLLAGRYTLLDQSGLAELLPEAARRGTSVIVGGVFNSGLLARPEPGATFEYAAAPEPVLRRAQRMAAVAARHGVPLRAAALRFPYGHPAVASVLSGARSAAEVRDAAAMLRHPVPAALWDDLRAEGLLPYEVPVPSYEVPVPSPQGAEGAGGVGEAGGVGDAAGTGEAGEAADAEAAGRSHP